MRRHTITATITACLGAAAPALAQDETETEPAAMPPGERSTLPKKRGLIQAFVEIDLSKDLVGDPVSLAPDIWYGVTDKLTLGLVHSVRGATGFMGSTGDGLCLVGDSCGDVYSAVGIDARFHLKGDEKISIAADVGVFVAAFDPFTVAAKVGAIGRWHSGKIAVEVAPNLFLGLTEREPEMMGMVEVTTNKEVLAVPVTLLFQVVDKVNLALQVGAVVPFTEAGDSWTIPVSVGAQIAPVPDVFVDVAFSFPQIAGGPDGVGPDTRSITVGGGYAF